MKLLLPNNIADKKNIFSIIEEKYPINSFINTNLADIETIYKDQKIRTFFNVSIDEKHSLEVSSTIHDYLQSLNYRNDVPFDQYSLAPVIGLFHHYYQNNDDDLLSRYFKDDQFRRILAIYRYLFNELLVKYLNSKRGGVGTIDLAKTQKEDYIFSKLLQEKIVTILESDELINNFICVLFFDFYVALKYFKEHNVDNEEIKILSLFVLKIFPLIMGVYKFGNWSSKLRDYAFSLYSPEKYNEIKSLVRSSIVDDKFLMAVNKHVLNVIKNFPARVSIQVREKGVLSAYLKSLSYCRPINELWDLKGMRIIIDSDDDKLCYQMSAQIQSKFNRWEDEKGYYNYIAKPKENGYQSIHLVLDSKQNHLIEVQIRTRLMHYLAELGSASHQYYKIDPKKQAVDLEYSIEVKRGKKMLEKCLAKNNLVMDDYIMHLKHALSYLPLEHYYRLIARNKYQPQAIVQAILASKRKK